MDKDLDKLRHSLAHLLAAAILDLYTQALPTIGPAIENGFYYDFDNLNISEKDLEKIEEKMREILPNWKDFEGKEVSEKEAREFFKHNSYKLELIDEITEKKEKLTFYKSGEFTDLCRGGHLKNPSKEIKSDAFKLDRIAGAYWRGDEKNKMLTRIYGLAFKTKKDLEDYEKQREEAAKRDHRKLGKELDLFTFSELVGSGLPLWTPKGTTLRKAIENKLFEISRKYNIEPVTIPHIGKRKLYELSGHAEKFSDELIPVKSQYEEFVMKPVNCPHHTQIYASKPRSYRDLPVRYMESTMQYRDEKPGEIGGLTRVRSITVDDGHIFCTPDQIKDEAKNVAKIIEEFYKSLGMFGNHWVSLSVRDPNHPEKYIGDEKDWQKAEKMLSEISKELKLDAKKMEGEAAIYGPKLDYMFKDSLGREWQLATIQIDFAMPKRFGLEYTNERGSKNTPVMIHRAILGSYERFVAILIEHFSGAFPFWLSPVQAVILPVSQKHEKYSRKIFEQLKERGVRVEIDLSDENLGKKVRAAKLSKIPYLIILGDKEEKENNLKLESRDKGDLGEKTLEELVSIFQKEI